SLAASLAASPELFPHALDPGRNMVALLRLSRADYERASFLDARIAGPMRPNIDLAWPTLAWAVEQTSLRESCHFIFHIGHVGSTLLSRLLGKHQGLFSLREPQILRTLAQMADDERRETYLPTFLKLWSRTFDPDAHALVKATSFVSEISCPLLARACAPRALFMGVAPETYLATIFGGANAPMEARMLAPSRLARLANRLGGHWRLSDMSEGEIVALGWATEASALAEAVQQAAPRTYVLNFDEFLAGPHTALKRVFAHFGVAIEQRGVEQILSGLEMKTYSKAPEFAYDGALRRSVLAEGRLRHATEIGRGLAWLDRLANAHEQVKSALDLFGRWSG
ncbi:MAG TPA: hypothetical protein VGI20_02390, partial [Rhizomicrobium sp.]